MALCLKGKAVNMICCNRTRRETVRDSIINLCSLLPFIKRHKLRYLKLNHPIIQLHHRGLVLDALRRGEVALWICFNKSRTHRGLLSWGSQDRHTIYIQFTLRRRLHPHCLPGGGRRQSIQSTHERPQEQRSTALHTG